jgi:hypothetical protein
MSQGEKKKHHLFCSSLNLLINFIALSDVPAGQPYYQQQQQQQQQQLARAKQLLQNQLWLKSLGGAYDEHL